ncbi:LysR substrate-binding domain-containing protein [Caballeronia sp. LZ065]|uniref:LysR substrate-binding domain-containing protein n=1 Tax=Caballeronia sp. LZ065 TaxID=3038571 RepID=UPI00285C004E|nr:LysR substrate-binding domain-containing protein [Caballeronia sp. LZ065]MDR5781661.1 LysR substrate-binding domain-containing protein [Caballeronia sp. LZ065]
MGPQLDIDLLRNFVAIAESGVMSRAAGEVGRTQAALSQQIKRLELIVEKPLLVRGARGVTLTMHGERLLVHARNILRTHDDAVAELIGESLSGSLRLGCPEDYSQVFVPPILQGFAMQHPQVLIEVVCAPTVRLLNLLDQHDLDLAIVSVPDGARSEQVLRRESFVWVGSGASDAMNHDPLQLALSEPGTLDHQAAITSLERIGRKYRIAYASASLAGLTAVVRSGQAIAVLTQHAVPSDLVTLPASHNLPALPSVGIVVQRGRGPSSRLLDRFEGHVKSVLPLL